MKFKFLILLALLLIIKSEIKGQDQNNRWAASFGGAFLIYPEDVGRQNIGFIYNSQLPRFSLARYMFKNVTFVGAFSTSFEEHVYTTFDGEARYDFGTSENSLSIYGLVGASLVNSKDYLAPFINFGGGGTLWVSDRLGLNGQLILKMNYLNLELQGSHVYASGGIVYRFSFFGGSSNRNIRRDRSRKRIWEMKH